MTKSKNQTTATQPLDAIYGDTQRITVIYYWFIGILSAGLAIGVFISLTEGDGFQALLTGLGILPSLASLYLIRRRKFELAAMFLALIMIFLVTSVATNDLGVHHISVIGYPAILIVASLVTRKRVMILLTVFTILCVAWLVFGELSGAYTPAPLEKSVPGDFFSLSLIIILTAVMVRLITESLFRANLRLQSELKERKRAEEKIQQHAARTEELASLTNRLTQATQDYQLVLDIVVRHCVESMGDGASILLYSPDQEYLKLGAVYNDNPNAGAIFRNEIQVRPIRVNEGAYAIAVGKKQPVLIESIQVDQLIEQASPERREYYRKLPIYSMMLVPLQAQGKLLGIIGIARHAPGKNYSPEDLTFLQDIADRSALAMLNAQIYRELEQELAERKRAETQVRQANEELEAKNAELERFTYTVSHDLKAPLITITGFLGHLEEDAIAGNIEILKHDSQRIRDAVSKMKLLLDELLELSRIGRLMNPPERVAFEDLVHEALMTVRGQLDARGVNVAIQPNMPSVHGDRQRLVEVLQNLIDNAAKFMGDQPIPRIEIGYKEQAGSPVFFVKDNGVGIEPRYHEQIFGLFNKLNPSIDGTGVGLALVKRIVEVHGGKIWIESKVGQGSTFYFTLASPPSL